jgi:hypothetical protein
MDVAWLKFEPVNTDGKLAGAPPVERLLLCCVTVNETPVTDSF